MTLLEVLIAGAVFATGAAATISATATYMNVMEHERKLNTAWRILQGDAGRLRALSDADAAWRADSSSTFDALGAPLPAVAAGEFVVVRTLALDAPIAGARQLRLEATWDERQGRRGALLVIHR